MDSKDALCQFVWQHYSRGKWVTFDDACIKSLNTAVQTVRRTTRITTKKAKQFGVNLHNLTQKDMSNNKITKIRPLVVHQFECVSWMYQDDDGTYRSYKPSIVFTLEVAFQKGEEGISFYDDGVDWSINMLEFKQQKEGSTVEINVMRENVVLKAETKEVSKLMKYDPVSRMLENESLQFDSTFVHLPSASSGVSQITLGVKGLELPSFLTDDEEPLIGPDPDICDSNTEDCLISKDDYIIYTEKEVAYYATLIVASIEKNTNKFCSIQLLRHVEKKDFIVFIQRGRIGSIGSLKELHFNESVTEAKTYFEETFHKLTKNHWKDKDKFEYSCGNYCLVNIDLKHSKETVESRLAGLRKDPSDTLTEMFELIMNPKMMKEVMKELSFGSFIPLGKLTSNQIRAGYAALSQVAKALTCLGSCVKRRKDAIKDLVAACDEFYSKIPHNCGSKKLLLLQTQEDVQEKLKLLEVLSNIRLAMKMLEYEPTFDHPMLYYCNSLKVQVKPLDMGSRTCKALKKCLKDSHGPTHTHYSMQVVAAFSCNEENDFMDSDVKKLLWHGSRLTNWVGILKQGLRVAPAEAPSSGYMFGKGIYFTNVSSKSANYCFPSRRNDEGLLALCEVSLGKIKFVNHAHHGCSKKYLEEEGFDSICCYGFYSVNECINRALSSEASTPCFPVSSTPYDGSKSLTYYEYVVYHASQVRIKYLLRVKFTMN